MSYYRNSYHRFADHECATLTVYSGFSGNIAFVIILKLSNLIILLTSVNIFILSCYHGIIM